MSTGQRTSPTTVRPIVSENLDQVARFLAETFPPDSPAEKWSAGWHNLNSLPSSGAPNHGMALWAGEEIVGAYPAIYSTRLIDGRIERFCNLAVWAVLPQWRFASFRMLLAILAQTGFHFTDLAPTPSVQRLNLRLGFRYLETRSRLTPNLPWPTQPKRFRVSSDPGLIEHSLTDEALHYYEDHAHVPWARHLVILRGDGACYVQWRFERLKGVRWFAVIQYVSDPRLYREAALSVSRHLAFRHHALFTIVEDRIVGGRIRPSAALSRAPRRMFKSATLGPDDIDYLYSEITAAP